MHKRKRAVGLLLGMWLAVVPTVGGCARGSGNADAIRATLAQSRDAQQAFQPIRHKWQLATDRERWALKSALEEFRVRFSSDPLARLANVYLAWINLEQGDLETAGRLAAEVRSGPHGSTQDLASLIAGAVQCREGRPEPALDLLTPLVGKLFDPAAQDLLHDQLVQASIQARRWFEALAYLDDWLRSAESHEVADVRARADRELSRFPTDSLELALRMMKKMQERAGYGDEIRSMVAARLGQLAVVHSDSALARTVLETTGNLDALGDAGDALAHLASSGGSTARIVNATLGLVLPPQDPVLRERGTDAVSGVLEEYGPGTDREGLDGGAGDSASPSPNLVVRNHWNEDVSWRRPFEELTQQGAAVIIAGFDAQGASIAAQYAEEESIPVILLSAPTGSTEGKNFTFVLGEDEVELTAGVVAAAGSGGRKVGRIGGPESLAGEPVVSCATQAPRSGEPRFPFARWRTDGVNGIAIVGPAHCARDVLAELSQSNYSPYVVLSPEASPAGASVHTSSKVVVARVGMLGSIQHDAGMDRWVKTHGDRPGWYAALGRDAAVLARSALRVLAPGTTTDQAEVRRRRKAVQEALRTETATLWTTDTRGFEGRMRVTRRIQY